MPVQGTLLPATQLLDRNFDMGGKNRSPDYAGLAAAQGEANREVVTDQTYANRPTQLTPWGYTQWSNESAIDPATGQPVTQWTQTQGLTPELQSILNRQIAIQGARTDVAGSLTQRMGEEFSSPLQWDNLSPLARGPNAQFTLPESVQRQLDFSDAHQISDPSQLRQHAEDAMYNRATSRLDPQFQQRRQALEIKLRNQGLGPEDEAYQAQMGSLDMQETDAYNQAMYSAVDSGRAEAGQLFGQDVTKRGIDTGEVAQQAGFYNQSGQQAFDQAYQSNQANFGQATQEATYANMIRQQQMAEMMQQRGFSLNEINALLSGQQVSTPQMPNFSNAGQAQPAPIYQAGVDQGNFNQAQLQMGMEGLGMLAGGFMR